MYDSMPSDLPYISQVCEIVELLVFHDRRSDDLANLSSFVDDVYAERAVGCIVRGVATPYQVASTLSRAARSQIAEHLIDDGTSLLGCMLAPTRAAPRGPDLDTYFDAAAAWHNDAIHAPVAAEITRTLSALAADRVTQIPKMNGHAYAPCTLRTFNDGAGAPAHCDSYPALPCHAHLDTLANRTTQLSWYLVLAMPDAGGELCLLGPRGHADATPRARYDTSAGDLVVFDGARHVHRIEPTSGPRARKTLGGFAGLSANGETLLTWG